MNSPNGSKVVLRTQFGWVSFPRLLVRLINSRITHPEYINLIVAIPVAGEGYPLTVHRPGRLLVIRRVVGQVDQVRSIGIHQVDFILSIPVGREGNPLHGRVPGSLYIHGWIIGHPYDMAGIIRVIDFRISIAV